MTIGREHKHRILEEETPHSSVFDERDSQAECSEEMMRAELGVAEQVPVQRKEEKSVSEHSAEEPSRLFSSEEAAQFRARWDSIQAGFVDEPQRAVKQADGLVTEVISRLTRVFAEERAKLEAQFDQNRHQDLSTEDLRLALRQYRDFFGRLLAV
jgi:hypothetical protein